MNIIVTKRDGDIECITLTEPILVVRSPKMNVLLTATGTSHFFDSEGYYDGWGMQLGQGVPQEDAYKIAIQTQKDQEVEKSASDEK